MTESAETQNGFAKGAAYVEGQFVPLAEARLAMLDRGFVRSDATYDVAHVWNGRFFRLDDHIARFQASMRGLRMEIDQSASEIRDILLRLVRLAGFRDAYVQMTCTRGVPPVGTRDPRLCRNLFSAFVQPFVWIANEQQRQDGLHMIVSATQRIPPESVDPRIKNFHWLDLTMGIFEAYEKGATVAVLPDRVGNITEGAGFNVFTVSDGALATPGRGVFEGMTRRTVIELCAELGLPCALVDIPAANLYRADEIFLTSTAGGIMPVTTVDGRMIGDGLPGPITRLIHDRYWALHDGNVHTTAV